MEDCSVISTTLQVKVGLVVAVAVMVVLLPLLSPLSPSTFLYPTLHPYSTRAEYKQEEFHAAFLRQFNQVAFEWEDDTFVETVNDAVKERCAIFKNEFAPT